MLCMQVEKDLGIWCTDDSVKPSRQCNRNVAKVMHVLGQLKRSFKITSMYMFLSLYKMYVKPHLEYCVQECCPYLVMYIAVLDKVKRVSLWFIPTALLDLFD